MTKPENRKADGKFKPGVSGNPGGVKAGTREVRFRVAQALDEAFMKDGRDKLVDAIVAGVETGDNVCMRIATDYRWGKPVTMVELSGPDGEPLGSKIDLSKLDNDDIERLQQIAIKAKGETK